MWEKSGCIPVWYLFELTQPAIGANFESFYVFIASSPFKPQIDFAPLKAFVINRKLDIRNSGIKHSFLTPAFIQPDIH